MIPFGLKDVEEVLFAEVILSYELSVLPGCNAEGLSYLIVDLFGSYLLVPASTNIGFLTGRLGAAF